MGKFIDRTGQRFGRLTAKELSHKNKLGQSYWRCVCDCGREPIVCGGHLSSGHTLSCGCYLADKNRARATHGESPRKNHSKEYDVWQGMRSRCMYASNKHYPRYGGRGIRVCDRWNSDFANFLADMGRCPDGMTLERIDNDAGYCKQNCAWRSQIDQANNRSTNRWITIDGETKTLMQWSRSVGTHVGTILDRIRRGKWSERDAVLTPPRPGNYRRKTA